MTWLASEALRLFDEATVRRRLSQLDLVEVWTWGIKVVLSLVILTLLATLTGGALKTFWDIRLLIDHSAEVVLRQIIVETLILLAIVRERRQIRLEELLASLPEFTWNQVFSLVDELSRRELICLRRRGFDYELRAASLPA